MRTLGKAVDIPPEYLGRSSPIVRVCVRRRVDFETAEWYAVNAAFTHYLSKDGKGDDGGVAEPFGPGAQDLDTFIAEAWRAPHTFQLIVSPAQDASTRLPLREFAESLMRQYDADLGVPLMWIGAVHFDTDEPHFQALLLGTTQTGDAFRISGHYIAEGMRARTAEVQAWYLGDV
jgi:type IV secretory pathway VirD2 relaxase